MAPEQALNSHRVDTRTDLYSLGGVLHFMLTGKIPFEGRSSAEKLVKHQSAAPTPVRQLKSDISEELEQIVLKLLAKKADVPIVPVAIVGAYECWPRTRLLPRPGRIRLEFGRVIPVAEIARLDEKEIFEIWAARIGELDAEARRLRAGRG